MPELRLLPTQADPPRRKRRLGMDTGRVQIADDFDAPTEDLIRDFEGESQPDLDDPSTAETLANPVGRRSGNNS